MICCTSLFIESARSIECGTGQDPPVGIVAQQLGAQAAGDQLTLPMLRRHQNQQPFDPAGDERVKVFGQAPVMEVDQVLQRRGAWGSTRSGQSPTSATGPLAVSPPPGTGSTGSTGSSTAISASISAMRCRSWSLVSSEGSWSAAGLPAVAGSLRGRIEPDQGADPFVKVPQFGQQGGFAQLRFLPHQQFGAMLVFLQRLQPPLLLGALPLDVGIAVKRFSRASSCASHASRLSAARSSHRLRTLARRRSTAARESRMARRISSIVFPCSHNCPTRSVSAARCVDSSGGDPTVVRSFTFHPSPSTVMVRGLAASERPAACRHKYQVPTASMKTTSPAGPVTSGPATRLPPAASEVIHANTPAKGFPAVSSQVTETGICPSPTAGPHGPLPCVPDNWASTCRAVARPPGWPVTPPRQLPPRLGRSPPADSLAAR